MARYRRMKRKFRSGTKYVKQTFQSFFDFNTDTNMQVLSIKSGGSNVTRRLAPFFAAFKYVKMGKVSIKMVPASTLPIDPTGLSYDTTEIPTVDPRDQLTPGMSRITNGELIFKKIPENIETQHKLYNQMLLDNRWFKWMLQTGVKKIAKPLAWQIAQIYQQPFPDQFSRVPALTNTDPPSFNKSDVYETLVTSSNTVTNVSQFENAMSQALNIPEMEINQYGTWQIGKNVQFGWLPTDAFVKITPTTDATKTTTTAVVNTLPECDLITILTPPAYKTKYYYRCYVTETYYFKEPVSNAFDQTPFYGSMDRFVYPAIQTHIPDGDFITLTGNGKEYKET